ncbi:MAG: glycosyltransferase [Bauldia sp.]
MPDWPRDRLDIKLIVEAADPATAAAARAAIDGPPYEVVVVPSVGPRTKPKALAFALPFARGALVTVYDAEDRPHPQQLRQAYAAFCRCGADVACLQSSVVVDNAGAGPLARLFAVEYAALFDGLLPALAALDLPLPLGGTSNHFRGLG